MTQTILTLIIIAIAVVVAGMKMGRSLARFWKKKQPASAALPNVHLHNCDDCSAQCALRDLSKQYIAQNLDQCKPQIKRKSD